MKIDARNVVVTGDSWGLGEAVTSERVRRGLRVAPR
jgi:NAD(P)-dependent dehydrogenase (short-subunit alcohol dehydrogenase family)